MTLEAAGSTAARSLGTISNQISVVSRNIASAGNSGSNEKLALLATNDSGVAFVGVGRAANPALFRSLLSATASQASANATADALDRIDQSVGLSDTTDSRSPSAVIAQLTAALQTYSASPNDETTGQLALSAASDVVSSLHDATAATQGERQNADAGMAADVADINDLLTKFTAVNSQVVAGAAKGSDITDALDQRDQLLTQLSTKIGIRTTSRANNDVVIYTDSGVTLFETQPRKVSFQETPNLSPGVSGAAVYIDGVQVTGADSPFALRSGELQGLAQVRDVVAPQYQSQLDEIARGLVVAFSEKDQSGAGAADLPGLFTAPDAVANPASSLVNGLAGAIVLNPTVDPAAGGDWTLLRDGGISGNQNYVYNKSGASDDASRILQLVDAPGNTLQFDASAGLGATGSLATAASNSNGWFEAERQQSNRDTTYLDSLASQATQSLSDTTGVNLDDQMSQMLALENSYQASAKLLETVNSLFSTLFSALHA